ncbi:hypothetical protein [Campylobacter sp.]|uniref:hypothetical protein n=1 Tax=Campylobacter sp. TaxID=205 RepID=UPI002709267C|nr:hypothetical protein [Campylobacter sp.]
MRKILVLAVVLANFAFGKDMFVFDMKVDLMDVNTKEVVGEIYEGTPVKFIKDAGGLALIEVSGEVAGDDGKILAYKKDPLVTFLKLKNAKAEPKAQFLIDAKKITKDPVAAWDEVDLFYYDACSSCHAAHKPKEHLMNEWEAYVTAMQTFAKINDEEKSRILRFLQAFAKDGIAKDE